MAKFVKDIHDLLNFLAGKSIASKQPPERIDKVLYEVALSLFVEHIDHYAKTRKESRFLDPFKRLTEIPVTTENIFTLPGDFQIERFIELEDGTEVEVIEDSFWTRRKNRKLGGPSLKRPISHIDDLGLTNYQRALELNVGEDTMPTLIRLNYFKTINKPKYAYTVSDGRYLYDEANTVDIEWNPLLFNQLKVGVLSGLGINLRENQVIQYSEMLKQEQGLK